MTARTCSECGAPSDQPRCAPCLKRHNQELLAAHRRVVRSMFTYRPEPRIPKRPRRRPAAGAADPGAGPLGHDGGQIGA